MCVCVCVLQTLSVLSEPGAIGALARASIVLCSLKGQWGVGGGETVFLSFPLGQTSLCAARFQICPDWHPGLVQEGS